MKRTKMIVRVDFGELLITSASAIVEENKIENIK